MVPLPVDVWTISLLHERAILLSSNEAARAARFHFERDRVRWSRSRSALRAILAQYTGAAPLDLQFVVGEHGKPRLPDFPEREFNLSHSGEYALIAVTEVVPVGIDIQESRATVDMTAMLRRLGETDLPSGTRELYGRWTQREARSKAAGGALFTLPASDIRAADLIAPEGYSAAVALCGFEPQPVYLPSL